LLPHQRFSSLQLCHPSIILLIISSFVMFPLVQVSFSPPLPFFSEVHPTEILFHILSFSSFHQQIFAMHIHFSSSNPFWDSS
jgi:hypothetical protein